MCAIHEKVISYLVLVSCDTVMTDPYAAICHTCMFLKVACALLYMPDIRGTIQKVSGHHVLK